jgi:hypothetical protein
MTATGHASDAVARSEADCRHRSFSWQLLWVLSADLRRSDWAVLSLVRSGARGHRDRRYADAVLERDHGRASDSGDPS